MVAGTEEFEALFKPNKSLRGNVNRAMRKGRVGFGNRIKVWRALRDPEVRQEIEFALTEKAMAAGAIPLESTLVNEQGIFVGDWRDLFDWVMENLPAILEMIMTIIALFG